MKFLIAGFGSIGRRHLRNLLALGQDDILLYRTHHSTLNTGEIEVLQVEMDLQAALAHKPDAVIVSNPTALHLDVAIPAAEAGCHILMEKPISHSLERIDDLAAALERGGGKLLVGYQFRFHPGLQTAKDLLAEGAIGKPVSFRGQWGEYLPNFHPWEDYRKSYSARSDLGGGVVLTLCHPLDYMRWLFGEVKSVSAMTANSGELDIPVEEAAEIGVRFANGMLGSVNLNYVQRPTIHALEVIGSEGTLRWDNMDGSVWVYRAAVGEWESFPAPAGFDRNDLFIAEMKHFLAVMSGEEVPRCTLADGRRALEIVQAVHTSAQTKQEVEL